MQLNKLVNQFTKEHISEACKKIRALTNQGDASHCVLGVVSCHLVKSPHCPRHILKELRAEKGIVKNETTTRVR